MKTERNTTAAGAKSAAPAKRWMVIDDDPALANILKALLRTITKIEIDTYTSGADAIAILANAPDVYEMVLTDLNMPGMNGLEVCARIAEINPELPVTLCTADSGVCAAYARLNGFRHLLHKPYGLRELAAYVLWMQTAGVAQSSLAIPADDAMALHAA